MPQMETIAESTEDFWKLWPRLSQCRYLSAAACAVPVTHRPACSLSKEQLLKAIGSFS